MKNKQLAGSVALVAALLAGFAANRLGASLINTEATGVYLGIAIGITISLIVAGVVLFATYAAIRKLQRNTGDDDVT